MDAFDDEEWADFEGPAGEVTQPDFPLIIEDKQSSHVNLPEGDNYFDIINPSSNISAFELAVEDIDSEDSIVNITTSPKSILLTANSQLPLFPQQVVDVSLSSATIEEATSGVSSSLDIISDNIANSYDSKIFESTYAFQSEQTKEQPIIFSDQVGEPAAIAMGVFSYNEPTASPPTPLITAAQPTILTVEDPFAGVDFVTPQLEPSFILDQNIEVVSSLQAMDAVELRSDPFVFEAPTVTSVADEFDDFQDFTVAAPIVDLKPLPSEILVAGNHVADVSPIDAISSNSNTVELDPYAEIVDHALDIQYSFSTVEEENNAIHVDHQAHQPEPSFGGKVAVQVADVVEQIPLVFEEPTVTSTIDEAVDFQEFAETTTIASTHDLLISDNNAANNGIELSFANIICQSVSIEVDPYAEIVDHSLDTQYSPSTIVEEDNAIHVDCHQEVMEVNMSKDVIEPVLANSLVFDTPASNDADEFQEFATSSNLVNDDEPTLANLTASDINIEVSSSIAISQGAVEETNPYTEIVDHALDIQYSSSTFEEENNIAAHMESQNAIEHIPVDTFILDTPAPINGVDDFQDFTEANTITSAQDSALDNPTLTDIEVAHVNVILSSSNTVELDLYAEIVDHALDIQNSSPTIEEEDSAVHVKHHQEVMDVNMSKDVTEPLSADSLVFDMPTTSNDTDIFDDFQDFAETTTITDTHDLISDNSAVNDVSSIDEPLVNITPAVENIAEEDPYAEIVDHALDIQYSSSTIEEVYQAVSDDDIKLEVNIFPDIVAVELQSIDILHQDATSTTTSDAVTKDDYLDTLKNGLSSDAHPAGSNQEVDSNTYSEVEMPSYLLSDGEVSIDASLSPSKQVVITSDPFDELELLHTDAIGDLQQPLLLNIRDVNDKSSFMSDVEQVNDDVNMSNVIETTSVADQHVIAVDISSPIHMITEESINIHAPSLAANDNDLAVEDDDWGDFDAAGFEQADPVSDAITTTTTSNDASADNQFSEPIKEASSFENSPANDTNDDDWGDFDDAVVDEHVTVDSSYATTIEQSTINDSSLSNSNTQVEDGNESGDWATHEASPHVNEVQKPGIISPTIPTINHEKSTIDAEITFLSNASNNPNMQSMMSEYRSARRLVQTIFKLTEPNIKASSSSTPASGTQQHVYMSDMKTKNAAPTTLLTETEHQVIRNIIMSTIPADAVSLDSLKPVASYLPRSTTMHQDDVKQDARAHTHVHVHEVTQTSSHQIQPILTDSVASMVSKDDDDFGDFSSSSHHAPSQAAAVSSEVVESSTAALGFDLDFLASVKTSVPPPTNADSHYPELDDFFVGSSSKSENTAIPMVSCNHNFADSNNMIQQSSKEKNGPLQDFLDSLPDVSYMLR